MEHLPKPKSYPKEIFFGSEKYKIKFKKNFDKYGETNAAKKTITIKAGMSRRTTMTTLIHELLHVLEFEIPVKIKHKTIYKLESAIMELLLDNFL
jgi:hypothetical protein